MRPFELLYGGVDRFGLAKPGGVIDTGTMLLLHDLHDGLETEVKENLLCFRKDV